MTQLYRLRWLVDHKAAVETAGGRLTPGDVYELANAVPALLALAESVGRLSMYESHELTSEQFEERLDETMAAYRRFLESLP